MIHDVVTNSYEKDSISFSADVSKLFEKLKKFNYDKIYNHPTIECEKEKVGEMYKVLFDHFLKDLKNKNVKSKIYQHFLDFKWVQNKSYRDNVNEAEKVRDYIAGMTDRYFENIYREISMPIRHSTFRQSN